MKNWFILFITISVSVLVPQADALRETQEISNPWRVTENQIINVSLVNNVHATPEKIAIIKQTLLSDGILQINDNFIQYGLKKHVSTYYFGWHGVLSSITDTKIPIPKNFEISNLPSIDGDIIVILSNIKDRSGYTGYTKTILDNSQIVKAFIIIFDVDSLSNYQLGAIMRHEFGHALGLGHSSDPEDLMASIIDTTYPYISQCNVMALKSLYDDQSKVTCEK